MIKYFTIEDLLKHYLQKKFHILDHDMHALRAGNVTGDQLTFHNKKLIGVCETPQAA